MKKILSLFIILLVIHFFNPIIVNSVGISYDNSVTNSSGPPTSPSSVTFTVDASASLIVLTAVNGASAWTPTGVTCGGVSMTQQTSISWTSGGLNGWKMYVYYLFSPPTGSVTCTVTSGTSSGGIYVSAASYIGTGSTIEASNLDRTTSGSTLNNTVTTLTDGAWTVGIGASNDNGSGLTANSNTVRRTISLDSVSAIFDSNGLISPPTSNTMIYNINGTHGGFGYIMSIPPPSTTVVFKFWSLFTF